MICACMGPVNGEEFCPCIMIDKGLATSESYKLTPEDQDLLDDFMEYFYKCNREAGSGS